MVINQDVENWDRFVTATQKAGLPELSGFGSGGILGILLPATCGH
jgi:hypothetical protein